MHYLQGSFDKALGSVVQHLIPQHRYCSVHDLFNPELFHSCLLAIIKNIPEMQSHIETLSLGTLLKQHQQNASYIQLRLQNFVIVWETMVSAEQIIGISYRKKVNKQSLLKLVKDCDLQELQSLLQHLFQLIIRNRDIVQFITTLDQSHQSAIKDFLQIAKAKIELSQNQKMNGQENQIIKLQQENAQLRALLINKQNELEICMNQLRESEQRLADIQENQTSKDATIESLRKRLIAYQETENMFQQKDQEIAKLQKKSSELQMNLRLIQSQYGSEKIKLQTKCKDMQVTIQQLQSKNQKLSSSYELIHRQKEDADQSSKRVITNLRDRVKALTEKTAELQQQLIDAKIGKQLREKQFSELMSNFESLKSQSMLQSTIQHQSQPTRAQRAVLGSGGGQLLRLEQQLCELDKLRENAFEQEIMMFESTEDNLKKVQEILAENSKLKERVAGLENRGNRDHLAETDKLRKRIAVLKKRAQQTQQQHRQELQLMISAFQWLKNVSQ